MLQALIPILTTLILGSVIAVLWLKAAHLAKALKDLSAIVGELQKDLAARRALEAAAVAPDVAAAAAADRPARKRKRARRN